MALKRMSPSASLLRTSRLFSLPPPIPKPTSDFTATANFGSDTATLPYPTQAAIETTESSLRRGDWGLKRPLPRQSTYEKTTTPTLRIHNIDSIDHITDYDSAADHALNLRKWQEMNLPVSMPLARKKATAPDPPVSAFESDIDNTEPTGGGTSRRRWKYKGPWLAGKTEGEFKEYVEKKVRRRKFEFRQFVRQRLSERLTAQRREAAIDSGEDIQPGVVEISETDVEAHMKELRGDEEKLNALVEQFLDLPNATQTSGATMLYNERGPPTTHPSAGLSYLRTKSHIHNHPVLGPMEVDPPVPGRVLASQKKGGRKARNQALLGVAGVAADDCKIPLWKSTEPPGLASFDPDIPGGAKLWVHPDTSSIDSSGRIDLRWQDWASDNTMAIYQGKTNDKHVPAISAATAPGTARRMAELSPRPRPASQGYGLDDLTSMESKKETSPLLGAKDQAPAQRDILGLLNSFQAKK